MPGQTLGQIFNHIAANNITSCAALLLLVPQVTDGAEIFEAMLRQLDDAPQPKTDFSRATTMVSSESWNDENFRERLREQMARDADKIRESCAFVRTPGSSTEITYRTGGEIMSATRDLCRG